jgi:hypothetical protein
MPVRYLVSVQKSWQLLLLYTKPATIVKTHASTMTNNNEVKDKICTDLDKSSLYQQQTLTSWLLWEASLRMTAMILKSRGVLLAAPALTNIIATYWFSSLTFPNSRQWLSGHYFWWPSNLFYSGMYLIKAKRKYFIHYIAFWAILEGFKWSV